MITTFEHDTELKFSVLPPLFLPFFNRWGQNAYRWYAPFSFDPFTLRAESTSGSPVLLSDGAFWGFLKPVGGRFSYDGCGTLTVTCSAGQALYYEENVNPYDAWQRYNRVVMPADDSPKQDFWRGLEYCTWVDQKHQAILENKNSPWYALSEKFVYDYMRRVEKLGLPHGKLTIDDGWDVRFAPDNSLCYGNWDVDREKFPHMEQLVKDMAHEGFLPGLWFAPFTMTPNCRLAQAHPELLGGPFAGSAESESSRHLMFLRPDPILENYYTDVFEPYVAMGFKKFKMDMSYGPKNEMIELMRMMHRVIKRMDPTVEIEAHISDIFAMPYCDTVRINDVAFDEAGAWRGVTMEHYKVCLYSSAGKTLNLDHLGTNTPDPKEEEYLEHTKMLTSLSGGYPCVSLLPDRFGPRAEEVFREQILRWQKKQEE